MGKLIAAGRQLSVEELYRQYLALLKQALQMKATSKKHCNVLQHIFGYFKRDLSADEKQEALDLVENYRLGLVPLVVPITLLNHFVRKYDQPYLKHQVYLHPHPKELKLLNRV